MLTFSQPQVRRQSFYSHEDNYYEDDNSGEMYQLQPSSQHTSLYRGTASPPRVGNGPKSGVNIMADLAEQTNKKNLLKTGGDDDGYITGRGKGPGMIEALIVSNM